MSAPDDERWLREYLAGADAPSMPSARAECLDDESLANLVDGALEDSVRASMLAHVTECARCRAAVASIARAVADPSLAREVAATERRPAIWWRRVAIPAAAAALLLVLVRPEPSRVTEDPHRARTVTEAVSPSVVSPAGVVSRADVLRWASVTGADRYRVTVFDSLGRIMYERQLADTLALLPDSVKLVAGLRYFWSVEARSGWNRWSSSELVEFSVGAATRR